MAERATFLFSEHVIIIFIVIIAALVAAAFIGRRMKRLRDFFTDFHPVH
jgi:hypothetical protein